MINKIISLTSLIELNVVVAIETKVYEDMIVHRGLSRLGYSDSIELQKFFYRI